MQTVFRWAAAVAIAMTTTAVFAANHEAPKHNKEVASDSINLRLT